MIRLFNAYFPTRTIALGVSEAGFATMAFILAMIAHLGMLNATIVLSYEQGFSKIGTIVGAFIVCMYYFDMYDSNVLGNHRELFTRLTQVLGTLCIAFGGVYYLFPAMHLGGTIFITGTGFVAIGILVWRRLFLIVIGMERFAEPCAVLGSGELANELATELATRPELGIRIASRIREDEPTLGSGNSEFFSSGIRQLVEQQKIKRIIVALGERRGKLPVEELLRLKTLGVKIQDGVEVYENISGKIALHSLRLSWLLFSPGFQVSPLLLIYKRFFATLLSMICLALALPLMVVIAIAIRLDSPGPIIFRQKRVGQNGRIFTVYKFRSMVDGTDMDGNFKPAAKDDVRVTRVGRWLRSLRLDELPQLFNILRGDMYFVGPRPFVPNQEEECARDIPFYRQRWSVKPGATGWAQVNRGYCATVEDNAEKLSYDLFYIKNMSIGLDLLIMFKTLKILILGRGGR